MISIVELGNFIKLQGIKGQIREQLNKIHFTPIQFSERNESPNFPDALTLDRQIFNKSQNSNLIYE